MNEEGQKLMTKQEYERRKEKMFKLRKQVLQIVENLIEPEIEEMKLIENCKYLSKNDYYDATVERSILNYCGYPLCTSNLSELSKKRQKFKINLNTHQVFDITDRKMFCSNLCFTKSNYLKDQLDDEALWLRDLDGKAIEPTNIKLYNKLKGSFGDEIKLDINLTKDLINELHREGDCLKYKLYCNDCCQTEDAAIKEESTMKCKNKNCKNKTDNQLDKSINFPYIQEADLNSLKDKLTNLKIKEKEPNLIKINELDNRFNDSSVRSDVIKENRPIKPILDKVVERIDKIDLKN